MEPKPLTDAEMDALSAQPQQAQPVQKPQPVKMSVPNRPLTDAEMDAMTAQPAVQAPKKQGILSAIAQPFKTFYKGTQGAGEVQSQVTGLAEKKQVKSIDEQNRLYAQSKTLPVGSPERRALIQQAGGLAQQEGMVADKSMKTLAEAPQAHQMIGATAEIASYGIGGGAAAKTAGTGIRAGIAQGAKAGLREGAFGGAVQGVGQAMQEDKPTFGSMVKGGLVGGALGGVLGTGLGAGVGALRAAPRMAESGAGRIMNSLIKPLSKDFAYGKNPGAGVANEGIIANSAEELGEKVFQKRQELGSNIGRLLDETPIPPQSIDDTVAIIDGELDSLRRNPQTNSAIINRLEGFKSDFLKLHTGQAPRTQGLSGQDIFNLKSELGDLTKWTGNASDDKIYNKTLKRMYGSLREKLENNIPGLSDLNERFANLTSAKNAIEHRSIIEARQNLVNLPGKIGLGVSGVLGATLNPVAIPAAILSIGIDNALSSTAFKTRFAQALMKMAPDQMAQFIESSPLIKRFIGALEKQGDLPPEVAQKIPVYGKNIEQGVPVKNIRQMDVNRPGVLSQQVKLGEIRKPAPVSRKIPVTEDKGFKLAKPKNYAGAVGGFEEDEDGKMSFDPMKGLGGALLGAGAMRAQEKGVFKKVAGKLLSGQETSLQKAIPEMDTATAKILRGTKGMTADDIMKTHPDIKLKRDIPATDVYGNKVKIPDGEVLTPYEMKGNKVLLQDGETYVVSKSQWENIRGQSASSEAVDFAPELKGTEETVRTVSTDTNADAARRVYGKEWGELTSEQKLQLQDRARKDSPPAKYSSYQLPDGKNYKEILIQAPETLKKGEYGDVIDKSQTFRSSHWDEPNVISHLRMNERTYQGKKVAFMEELQSDWAREGRSKGFSDQVKIDWKPTKNGDLNATYQGKDLTITPEGSKFYVYEKGGLLGRTADTLEQAKMYAQNHVGFGIPNNPLLKNWQEPTIKRALKDAVDSDAEYFAWINGEQTSARYNLATYLEDAKWKTNGQGSREVTLRPKQGSEPIVYGVDKNGVITYGKNHHGQKLDEVLGKGLADKIMADEAGTLSGEGLKFGGEWASNLYDKQVGDIVRKLTGAKVEVLDLGLPIDNKGQVFITNTKRGKYGHFEGEELTPKNLKVGQEIRDKNVGTVGSEYIITEVLGDGKFKAIGKNKLEQLNKDAITQGLEKTKRASQFAETFDISTKTTTQQGIRLTPEIKAKIRGEAPGFKASGKQFEEPKQRTPVEALVAVPGLLQKKQKEAEQPNPKSPQSNFLQATTRPTDSLKRISARGTNYDPMDPSQTRKNTDGKGAAGVKMTDRMVAVMRRSASDGTPSLPYGTIIYVPELDKEFMVADIFNYRYNSNDSKVTKVDFAVPGSGKKILPEYNRELTIQVVEMGKGAKDAREKASRFQGVVDE